MNKIRHQINIIIRGLLASPGANPAIVIICEAKDAANVMPKYTSAARLKSANSHAVGNYIVSRYVDTR